MSRRKAGWIAAVAVAVFGFAAAVWVNAADPPDGFDRLTARADRAQFLDRTGLPLNASYQSYWNVRDAMRLYEFPPKLVEMFIRAEDRNFYAHGGVDWRARVAAAWQNLRAGGVGRGADDHPQAAHPVFKNRRRR